MLKYDFQFILVHVSIILLLGMAVFLLRVKHKSQFHIVYLANIFGLLIWSGGLLAETYYVHYTGYSGMFFLNIAYLGICFVPVLLMYIGFIFAHTKIQYTWRHLLLLIVPVTSLLMLWTNDYHHLFYQKYSAINNEVVYGPYFNYVHVVYSYACILIGLIYLIYFSIKNSGLFSKQAVLLIIGSVVPVAVNVLFTLNIITLSAYATPVAFSFFLICCMIATIKYNFLNLVPIALQKVVDHISDSFVVLDEELTIIDYNKTFVDTFKNLLTIRRKGYFLDMLNSNPAVGMHASDFMNAIGKARELEKSSMFEKHISGTNFDKFFTVEITPIYSNKKFIGTIVLLKDITEYKKSLETIKNNQMILVERERLASLGQLVGGIAHNLKTPIMSIAGGLEALKDLINEYEESIDDPDVTRQDHHEIAAEMMSWIEKIKPYCSYMSDIISAVKGQAVQLNDSSTSSFTVDEVVRRVDVLMKHELKKCHCNLNTSVEIDLNTEIKGEINNLVQILDNVIINAIHAYEGESGQIDFNIYDNGNDIVFMIRDYGKGIPDDIQKRLFKEMVTTKGKNGTGLGLYMSYSTIKGRFGGNMWFETEKNKGTTFYISIPKTKNEVVQEVS